MKISVVMATYNGAEFLVEQLESIRKQTKKIDELVICDDRSKDDTVTVAQSYIDKNNLQKQWKIIVNEENLGYANNFNKATLLATGDLIFFSDQDDIWREDKVQIMTDIMENHMDCQVLCTDYTPHYVGENAPTAPKKVLNKMPDNGDLEKISLTPKSIYIGAIGCCMCVRREFYENIREYWFDGWAQDDRMWKLAQCADGCYILHTNLIQHRLHANNTSTYGKYHTVEKRVKLFHHMLSAGQMMRRMLGDAGADGRKLKQMEIHNLMLQKRIELLEKRKILRTFGMVKYLGYYQEPKSLLVEAYLALKKWDLSPK